MLSAFMPWVYVVRNPESRLYIGMTTDLDERLEAHNCGKSKWTKSRGPWELVWESECATVSEARRLERKLKRQHGGNGLKRFIGLDSGS